MFIILRGFVFISFTEVIFPDWSWRVWDLFVLLNFLVFCVVFVFALCLILRGLVFFLNIYFSVLKLTSICVLVVLMIFLVFCVVLCFYVLCCVCLRRMSCVQCFLCLWIVLFWLPLRFSLTFTLFALCMLHSYVIVYKQIVICHVCIWRTWSVQIEQAVLLRWGFNYHEEEGWHPIYRFNQNTFCTLLFQARTCIYIP